MKIGIDARFYGPRAKGLGRYNQKLLEELEKIDGANDYVVFLRRENFDEIEFRGSNFRKVLADFKWYSWGEQFIFPWLIYRQKIDLMHFTHFNLPIFYRRPYMVTIHDLILRSFGTARGGAIGRMRYWFKNAVYNLVICLVCRRAQKIIAVSEYVKNDIIRSFGVESDKVKVIYEGAPASDIVRRAADDSAVLEKYKIKKPYLLYVGNAYPHKNLARLIEAFKRLKKEYRLEWRLALVGGEDYFYRQLKKNYCDEAGIGVDGGVIFAGFAPDSDLDILYQSAGLYVFPSLCEGFGLPPLEAMSFGAPVASSSSTCLPEILGEAAHYFDATDIEDIIQRVHEAATDEILRQRLVAAGRERIKKYSWLKMAAEIRDVYISR